MIGVDYASDNPLLLPGYILVWLITTPHHSLELLAVEPGLKWLQSGEKLNIVQLGDVDPHTLS